ncbi:mycofactocin-coupled SDR family oxidoreductase [Nocardia rhamnosiphila]
MGRMDGKVALITGGARGQGRSHALTLAREGAAVVVTDICEPIPEIAPFTTATQEDLDETKRLVEAAGGRCLAIKADARSSDEMVAAVDRAIGAFGKVDVLASNHGVGPVSMWDQQKGELWDSVLDTNLSASWTVARAVIPHMMEQKSGSIVFTASSAGVRPSIGLLAYTVSKTGLLGLMRSLAVELGPYSIRVNAVLPGSTATEMLFAQPVLDAFNGGPGGTIESVKFPSQATMLLPVTWMEPQDISNGVLFLASEESRYVTGIELPVDGGTLAQPPGVPAIAAELIGSLKARLAEEK